MERLLSLLILFLLFGCGGGGEPGPTYTSYAGTWGYDDPNTKIRVYLSLDPAYAEISGYHGVYSPYTGRAEFLILSDTGGTVYAGESSQALGNDAGALNDQSSLTMYIPVHFVSTSSVPLATVSPTTPGSTAYDSLTFYDLGVNGKSYILKRE